MRRSLLLPCLLIAGSISVYAVAQTDNDFPLDGPVGDQPAAPLDPIPVPFQPDADEPLPPEDDAPPPVSQNAEELQAEFLRRMTEKAALMDKAALQEAIGATEKEIVELKADAELETALASLRKLLETYPETESAMTARRMIRTATEPQTERAVPYSVPGFPNAQPGTTNFDPTWGKVDSF